MAWSPKDWEGMTLKEFVVTHDSFLLDRWDHTSYLYSVVHSLTAHYYNKNKEKTATAMKYKTSHDCHPYRGKSLPKGMALNDSNFRIFKTMFARGR